MIVHMYLSADWTTVPDELKASTSHEINMITLYALYHMMEADHDSFGDTEDLKTLVRLTRHIKHFVSHP